MSVLYTVPQVVDADGGVVTCTAKFFVSGTTTPLDVYSDSDLSTSLGSTITANSVGWFGGVYLQNKNYRVNRYVDAVELDSTDDIDGRADSTSGRIYDPRDYGAVITATSTDSQSTALQDTYDAANTAGGGTVLWDGLYNGDVTLNMYQNVKTQGVSSKNNGLVALDNFTDMQAVTQSHPTAANGEFYSNIGSSSDYGTSNYFKWMKDFKIDMSAVTANTIAFYSSRNPTRVICDNLSVVGNPLAAQVAQWFFHTEQNDDSASLILHWINQYCDFTELYGNAIMVAQGNDLLQSRSNNIMNYFCRFAQYNQALDLRGIANKDVGTTFNKQIASATAGEEHHQDPIYFDDVTKRFRGSSDNGVADSFDDALANGRNFRATYSDGTANTHGESWDEVNSNQAFAMATGTRTNAITLSLLGMGPTIQDPEQIADVVGTVGNTCTYVDANTVTVSGDVTDTYLDGRSVVVFSKDATDMNGSDHYGREYFGESYTTVNGNSTYDGGTQLTTIVLTGAFASSKTSAIREIDVATRISDTQFTIIKGDDEDYEDDYIIHLEMADDGVKSSTIASTSWAANVLTVNLTDSICTDTTGIIVSKPWFRYSRVPLNGIIQSFKPNLKIADELTVGDQIILDGSVGEFHIWENDLDFDAIEIKGDAGGGVIEVKKGGALQHRLRGTGSVEFNISGQSTHDFIWYGNGGQSGSDNLLTVDSGARFVNIGNSVDAGGALQIRGSQVLGERITTWSATTGTEIRTDFGDASLSDTSQALRALIVDLKTHGIIGT